MIKYFKILCLLFTINLAIANDIEVRFFQSDHRYDYRIELLEKVLSKVSTKDKNYKLKLLKKNEVTHGRGLKLLETDYIDVASLGTSKIRESKLLPIKIPILNGLLGYRILFTNNLNAEKISKIKDVYTLKNFDIGFGKHWGDYSILKHNGLNVVPVVKYELLFKMLNQNRFEIFPRGVNEYQSEFKKYAKIYKNISVNENIALYYNYPVYFFVNKNKKKLASDIEKGLLDLKKSGEFKKIFNKYHAKIIKEAKLKSRKIIMLNNPTLPEGTPVTKPF